MDKNDIIIKATNLFKIYNLGIEEVYALNNVSLSVKKGEFVAIMGASGSGKSTLMHILGCLDRPTTGTILLDGVDTSLMKKDELAEIRNKKIGFIFQMFNLLARVSALANAELPLLYNGTAKEERHKKALVALEKVGLAERINHHPSEMSGGQQQRVAIARALITNPPIIMADEPTGNLDSKSGKEIMDILKALNKAGHTIVMVTHDRTVADNAERIIIMKDGVINEEINKGRTNI